jgi:hypothetical protein
MIRFAENVAYIKNNLFQRTFSRKWMQACKIASLYVLLNNF